MAAKTVDLNQHKLLFIGGLHRSGTSIIFKLLKQQNNLTGFANTGVAEDEGQLIQTVYPKAYEYGGPGRFGFSEAMHLTENSPLVSPQNQEKLLEQWSPWWDLKKKVLIEKSPPNITKTRFLQALFEDSYFLIVRRHPIAVAGSTITFMQRFTGQSNLTFEALIQHWIQCHRIFDEDKSKLKKLMIYNFEDFIIHPDGILKKISEFIEEPLSLPADQIIKPNENQKYFNWWRSQSEPDKEKIINTYEKSLNTFGYSLIDLDQHISF